LLACKRERKKEVERGGNEKGSEKEKTGRKRVRLPLENSYNMFF